MRFSLLASMLIGLCPTLAAAQMMPGQPRPGGGLPPPSGEEKEEGPAEQAPEEPEKEQSLQPLPGFARQREKQLQFFQLAGYQRFRSEFWHDLHLGFQPSSTQGTPFQVPADCYPPPVGTNPRNEPASRKCDSNLSTANMRLRLEPQINVSEQVRVHAQVDLLDNLVFGSTPDGLFLGTAGVPTSSSAPPPPPAQTLTGLSTRSQAPPQAGRNSLTDSVQVKRAWAEVRTPVGDLSFGRMPAHWGMGMFENAGDCRHTPDCLDSDYGVNIDRVMFETRPLNLYFAGAFDWAATGPTSDRLAASPPIVDRMPLGTSTYGGEPFDATNRDDVSQYTFMLGKIDTQQDWQEKVDRGDKAWNLGTMVRYRSQDLDQSYPMPATPTPLGSTPDQVGQTLVKRSLSMTTIDVWGRWSWHHLLIEAEGAVILGNIAGVKDLPDITVSQLDIRQGGGVGRMVYGALHNTLKLRFEAGFATGDQAESPLAGQTNYLANPVLQPAGDHTLTNFSFDPDYHVDLILFRRILGTVTNAIYAKPSISWDVTDYFGGQFDIIASFPHVPVSTPGNGRMYGLELDATIGYKNVDEGFFAGVQYGLLVPFGALDEPTGGVPAPLFPSGGGASTAQVLRTYLAVKF
jgi:uncharacterized protein (TIGR04551 family)